MSHDLITIGKVTKHRGLHGELKVIPITDLSARLLELKEVTLVSPDDYDVVYKIRKVRCHKGIVLLSLEGCNTVEEAKRFINWLIKIPKEQIKPLPSGSYYWHDLIGMKVHTDEGLLIGDLIDIFPTGSNDVFVVKGREKEHLIPATREVVKDVDVAGKQMTIHIIKGLIEEDEM